MKLTSQNDMVFFCADPKIGVWSQLHRLGSFGGFAALQLCNRPAKPLDWHRVWRVLHIHGTSSPFWYFLLKSTLRPHLSGGLVI